MLDAIAAEPERARRRSGPAVAESPLALVQVPDIRAAIDLANAFAPEHLELLDREDADRWPTESRTAGCVFVGRYSATAFGDYVAGSNHVLPTGGAGRFSGPLGPGVFRRKIADGGGSGRGGGEACPARRHPRPRRGIPRPRRVGDD